MQVNIFILLVALQHTPHPREAEGSTQRSVRYGHENCYFHVHFWNLGTRWQKKFPDRKSWVCVLANKNVAFFITVTNNELD